MYKKGTKLTIKYLGILLFYVPMYFIKMLGLGSGSKFAIGVTAISFILSVAILSSFKMTNKEKWVWIALFVLGSLVMLQSGKYIIMISIFAMFLLRDMDIKLLQKILVVVGVIALVILVINNQDSGSEQYRFINGTWSLITKRSNTIFVAYFMVFNLVLLLKKPKNIILLFGLLFGIILFQYTYSRTGMVCLVVEVIIIIMYRMRWFQNSKIIKMVICSIPMALFVVSVLLGYLYGKVDIVTYVDNLLQHRIINAHFFLSNYSATLFGQKVYISTEATSYAALDNTYLNLYLNYGVILTLVWCFINTWTINYAYKNKRYIEVAILIAYLCYGFTESFILVAFLNPSFFFYVDYLKYYFKGGKLQKEMEST